MEEAVATQLPKEVASDGERPLGPPEAPDWLVSA